MGADIAGLMERGGWLLTYGAIFLGGLALNLTPCVYPLVPITVGYFSGQGQVRRAHAAGLSLLYVLGIAITYSLIGVAAALSGEMLGFLLQKPLVLLLFSGLMVALAFGQFGLFDLRPPSLLESGRRSLPRGLQALAMGLAAGIVAAPCIGPFVLGLLLYVGRTQDPLTGFAMFLTLALGLGLPYFVLGLFTGVLRSLPRSGPWLVRVKKAFGFVLLMMALSFAKPLLGETAYGFGMALVVLAALGTLLWATGRGGVLRRVAAMGVAVVALVSLGVLPVRVGSAPDWVPYSASALEKARNEGKPVVIDFWADWCLPCKEMDAFTFSRPEVREAARRIVMIKADVTLDSTEASRHGLERFEVEGVPTVVFLDGQGRERRDLRVTAFVRSGEMLDRMTALVAGGASPGGTP